MTKRLYIGAFILLAAMLSVLLWQMFRPREHEPVYQGKTLSQWLVGWDPGQNFDPSLSTPAIEAVRKMGTNALPYLIDDFRSTDALLWRKLPQSAYEFRVVRNIRDNISGRLNAGDRRTRAAFFLKAIGPAAKPVIPALSDCLSETNTARQAAGILGYYDGNGRVALGTNAIPALLKGMTNGDLEIRRIAVNALGLLRGELEVVVPPLLHALKDPSPAVRAMAASSFGAYKAAAPMIVPPLIETLDDTDPRVRARTAWMLGMYRAQASNAVPKLLILLNDPDSQVQIEATNALKLIVPELPNNRIIKH